MAKIASIALLSLALSGTDANSASPQSDDDIKAALIGSWIVSPNSADYGPENRYAVETYGANGIDLFVVYSDRTCKKIAVRVTVKWTVQDRILSVVLRNGKKLSNEVLSIKGNTMTVRSLDGAAGGVPVTRERGTPCSGLVS
jgi:hypothetical protein